MQKAYDELKELKQEIVKHNVSSLCGWLLDTFGNLLQKRDELREDLPSLVNKLK